MNDWIQAISDLSSTKLSKVPPGWKTSKQIAQELNKSVRTATYIIQSLKEKKLVDTQTFIIKAGDGIRPVNHYKIKSK